MKKLLLLLLTLAVPAIAMQKQNNKRKHEDTRPHKIKFSKPFYDKTIPSFVIKAKEKGLKTPIGTITFNHAPKDKNTGHIYELKVNPEHQGTGIGYQLFKRAILELKKQGYPQVTWLAYNTDSYEPLPLAQLEDIYISIIRRLGGKIACDLEIEPRRTDMEATPFRLIFKSSHQNTMAPSVHAAEELTRHYPAPHLSYSPVQVSADRKNLSLNASYGTHIIGSIHFRQDPVDYNIGEILHLYVNPNDRNQGIGYQLFKRAILELVKNNYVEVTWLSMQTHDTPIEKLENIFSKITKKLRNEIQFDFIMKKRLMLGKTATQPEKLITPMQLIFNR